MRDLGATQSYRNPAPLNKWISDPLFNELRGSEIHRFACAGLRLDKSNLNPARRERGGMKLQKVMTV